MTEATSLQPLLSMLAAGNSSPTLTQFRNAGLDPNRLLRQGLARRLPWCAWMIPGCEDACLPDLDFRTRRESGEVGAACPYPPGCWEHKLWFVRDDIERMAIEPENLLAYIARTHGLAPLTLRVPSRAKALGCLERRGLRLPMLWLRRPTPDFELLLRGLASDLGGDGLVMLLSRMGRWQSGTKLPGNILLLGMPGSGRLPLLDVMEAFDPDYRCRRAQAWDALFDEVILRFSCQPGERHLVTINGHTFAAFQKSDLNFLRFLFLAAAAKSGEDGGWVNKMLLEDGAPDKALQKLRRGLHKYPIRGLSSEEGRALIKASKERPGEIRLAVPPANIHFDASLRKIEWLSAKADPHILSALRDRTFRRLGWT